MANDKNKNLYFYINPMSYNNLVLYDKKYLETLSKEIKSINIVYVNSYLDSTKNNNYKKTINLYKYNKIKNNILKSFSYFKSNIVLIFILIKANPKFIHFQWFKFNIIDLFLLLIIRLFCKSIIIFTVHNAKNRFSSSLINAIDKQLYKNIDWFIFHTKACIDTFSQKHIKSSFQKFIILRHGLLNYKNSKFPPHREDFQAIDNLKNSISSFDNKFIFIGKGSKYKGLDILLSAWELFIKRNKENRNCLVIAGKIDKEISKDFNEIINEKFNNILIYDYELSDYFLSEIVNLFDFIFLSHKFISHSGIYSSFLEYKKPFIFNSSKDNHMNQFPLFKKTGFGYYKSNINLLGLLEDININGITKYSVKNKIWEEAISFFSWEQSFKDSEIKQ